eukprot:scaffold192013_cov60-Attheya_sp.AAC.2
MCEKKARPNNESTKCHPCHILNNNTKSATASNSPCQTSSPTGRSRIDYIANNPDSAGESIRLARAEIKQLRREKIRLQAKVAEKQSPTETNG